MILLEQLIIEKAALIWLHLFKRIIPGAPCYDMIFQCFSASGLRKFRSLYTHFKMSLSYEYNVSPLTSSNVPPLTTTTCAQNVTQSMRPSILPDREKVRVAPPTRTQKYLGHYTIYIRPLKWRFLFDQTNNVVHKSFDYEHSFV